MEGLERAKGAMMLSLSATDLHVGDILISVIVGLLLAFMLNWANKLMKQSLPFHATLSKIEECFPSAIPNEELIKAVKKVLEKHGFGKTSLVATSLCCDEVNRTLEKDLASMYGQYFSMGGLAGVPFGGVTAFGGMAAHIPDGGSCLVVFGPHVGVDAEGKVGTVNRRGRQKGGPCCSSAVAAFEYVQSVMRDQRKEMGPPDDAIDAQQTFVGNLLLPFAERLKKAKDPMVELPNSLFDAQYDLMQKIVAKGCGKVAENGKIAMLGGIQINTPPGISDYFLPLRFDVISNKNEMVQRIIHGPPRAALAKINTVFAKAVPNAELVQKVSSALSEYGFGKSSLLCTSLCSDEVSRPLEKDFQAVYGEHFNIGGLAGFAFGGLTGFGYMAAHIPDEGSCLIVFGPHVGVDSQGRVGTVDLRGREKGGPCCGSGVAAAMYVHTVKKGLPKTELPTDALDAQQVYVGNLLLKHADRLDIAEDPMVELPFALYAAQDELMQKIVAKGCGAVAKGGKIALMGGVQINTPDGMSDYFLPLRFDIRGSDGKIIEDLRWDN